MEQHGGMAITGKRRRNIVDLKQREVGLLSPRIFAQRVSASKDLVLLLGIHKRLDKHKGCVNTVSFNSDGDILVSGSDDRMIMLWDWDAGVRKLSFHSGHSNNVFQARFVPWTDDRTMVTCAADGEVRQALIAEGGNVKTKMLALHEGRVHKIAIDPGSPHIFYSCGEDGLVHHFDLRTESATKLFTCKPFLDKAYYMSVVNLHSIAIDPRNPNLFAVAGSDEYARLYDIRKHKWNGSSDFGHPTDCFCPSHLMGNDVVGITGLAFSDQSELLVSYSHESIYLFTREQGLGPDPIPVSADMDSSSVDSADDPNASPGPQEYKEHINRDTVKGVSFFGPNCEYVVSGSDCGRVFIWMKKGGEILREMRGDRYVVNCIEPHPYATAIASSGLEKSIKIWTPCAKEPAPPINFEELKQRRKLTSTYYFIDWDDDSEDDDDDAAASDVDMSDSDKDLINDGDDSNLSGFDDSKEEEDDAADAAAASHEEDDAAAASHEETSDSDEDSINDRDDSNLSGSAIINDF